MTRFELTVDGERVGVATGGVAPNAAQPVAVLVHGAGMNRTVWQQQTRYLAHHGVSALALDLPGHGRSGGAPRSSIDELADWLGDAIDAICAQLDCEQVALVGHSMGSLVCVETAAAKPERVRHLVLAGTAAAMGVHPALLDAAQRNEPLAAALMTAWGHGPAGHVADNPTPGLWMLGGSRALLEVANDDVIYTDLAACAAYGPSDAASRVACDATVIVGGADKMTPPRAAAEVIAELSDPNVVHLADVGHMMMNEAPDAVRAALLTALR